MQVCIHKFFCWFRFTFLLTSSWKTHRYRDTQVNTPSTAHLRITYECFINSVTNHELLWRIENTYSHGRDLITKVTLSDKTNHSNSECRPIPPQFLLFNFYLIRCSVPCCSHRICCWVLQQASHLLGQSSSEPQAAQRRSSHLQFNFKRTKYSVINISSLPNGVISKSLASQT